LTLCARATAYSSSANLGPGYDVLALAHTAFQDRVEACIARAGGERRVEIVSVEGPEAERSGGAATAGRAVEELLGLAGVHARVELRVWKGIPPGRGLGSSGATAAAAVAAVSRLIGVEDASLLLEAAGRGEAVAAGQPHYDNVAASLQGGLVAVAPLSGRPVAARIPLRGDLHVALLVPEPYRVEGKTRLMRSVLPGSVPLQVAARNYGRSLLLVAAACSGSLRLLGEALMGDEIVEPARAPLIPCLEPVRRAALEAGAYGATISGAGPSIIAVAGSRLEAERAGRAMLEAYSGCGSARSIVAVPAPGALESVEVYG